MHIDQATTRPVVAWRPLLAVLAVIAFLTGGWLLVSAPLPDTEPVPAGASVSVGPDRPAAVTVAGDGWRVRKAKTNLDQEYALTNDTVDFSMQYVSLPFPADPTRLWSGLQEVARANGARLGEPAPARTEAGVPGRTGPLHQDGKTGTGYAFPAPDGTFAMQVLILGPPQAPAGVRSAADRMVRSLTFQAGGS